MNLPPAGRETFFLWGPRQTGKTWLLRARYPGVRRIDLLETDTQLRYLREPYRLREEMLAEPDVRFAIIDEVQKVPALLDEVHWLIEHRGLSFGLCGSSARKVRRGHANLLGGRAVRYELLGLVSEELGEDFDLIRMLNHGGLPPHYLADRPRPKLSSYVNDYLKQEVAAEGLVRSLPLFADFLEAAALTDTELVKYANIARECGISAPAVRGYFEILVDTLLGRFLPAYRRRPKRRVIQAPKFYFVDVGVVNVLARRGRLEPGSELFGKALESWVYHELCAHRAYRDLDHGIYYWRLASGIEVDFVLGEMEAAIEVKGARRAIDTHLKGLRALREDHPRVKSRILVCLEPRPRRTTDGIDILPAKEFARRLWSGSVIG